MRNGDDGMHNGDGAFRAPARDTRSLYVTVACICTYACTHAARECDPQMICGCCQGLHVLIQPRVRDCSCVSPVVWGAPHLESGDGDVDFDVLGLARTHVNLEVMVV